MDDYWEREKAEIKAINNWMAVVTSPDGSITHELPYFMRHQAEGALQTYLSYGWTGHVELISH